MAVLFPAKPISVFKTPLMLVPGSSVVNCFILSNVNLPFALPAKLIADIGLLSCNEKSNGSFPISIWPDEILIEVLSAMPPLLVNVALKFPFLIG